MPRIRRKLSISTSGSTSAVNSPSPRKTIGMNDGPIKELTDLIDRTKPENWKKRVEGFVNLVSLIPTGDEYSETNDKWYNSPASLRNLTRPVSQLLKDRRSSVVKRTCELLSQIFSICKANTRYLLKDLMPTMIAVHGQTIQIIRTYVQAMAVEAIPVVPCKMAMPIWLEALKTEKSRTARDACVLYLGLGVQHWNESGYLSDHNLYQVGTALIKSLRDPAPAVRNTARQGLETMRNQRPTLWDKLVADPNGPAAKDRRLQQWLLKATAGDGGSVPNEDYSVASRYTCSNNSIRSKVSGRFYSPSVGPPLTSSNASAANNSRVGRRATSSGGTPIPKSIELSTSSLSNVSIDPSRTKRQLGGPRPAVLGPPQRLPTQPNNKNRGNITRTPIRRKFSFSERSSAAATSETNRNNGDKGFLTPIRKDGNNHDVDCISPISQASITPDDLNKIGDADKDKKELPIPPFLPEKGGNDDNDNEDDHILVSAPPIPKLEKELPKPGTNDCGDIVTTTNTRNEFQSQEHQQHYQSQLPPMQNQEEKQHHKKDRRPPPTPEINFSRGSTKSFLPEIKISNKPLPHRIADTSSQTSPCTPTEMSLAQELSNDNEDYIADVKELKEVASKRRSRRSHLLQERLRTSTASISLLEDGTKDNSNIIESIRESNDNPTIEKDGITNLQTASDNMYGLDKEMYSSKSKEPTPKYDINSTKSLNNNNNDSVEHIDIAHQLLRAHKAHVDTIMETLKIEMDSLRNFENAFKRSTTATTREDCDVIYSTLPTEDQVLDYFESVGLCLDQRTTAGTLLLKQMDLISRGEKIVHNQS